jgi:hypothetical protein
MQTLLIRISNFAFVVYASLSLVGFGLTVSTLATLTGAPVA